MVAGTFNQCGRCNGALKQTEPDELTCMNCGNVVYLQVQKAGGRSVNGHHGNSSQPLFDNWERNTILDALTEVYLRTKGNIRRSQLEITRAINEEKAAKLGALLEKVKHL